MEFNLTDDQAKAVNCHQGPLCIVAGAGSGKTRVLTERTMSLINDGVNPSKILLLTFTNKAANEMKSRIIQAFSETAPQSQPQASPVTNMDTASFLNWLDNSDYQNADALDSISPEAITATTFHSFCVKVLRRFGKRINLSDFTVMSGNDGTEIMKMIRSEDISYKYTNKFPTSKTIISILSNAVNTESTIKIAIENYRNGKYVEYTRKIYDLVEKYDKYRKTNNILNYDDLLVKTLELFEKDPRTVQQIAEQYEYIMVDEYQDSNTLQEKLLFSIAKYHQNIAIVGDEVQSLYGFRGADIRNIQTCPDKFKNCERVYLNQNFRSSQEILDFSNAVTELATETKPHTLQGNFHTGEKPYVIRTKDQIDEAVEIYEKIREKLREGTSPEEICVLFRNSTSVNILEGYFKRDGINYVKYGGIKFFDLEYVQDVLSFMRIAVNPCDEIAWFRCLQLVGQIGEINARKIARECKKNGIEGMMDEKYKNRVFYNGLKELYDYIKKANINTSESSIEKLVDFYTNYKIKKIKVAKFDKEENRQEALTTVMAQQEELMVLAVLAKDFKKLSEFLDSSIDSHGVNEEEGGAVLSTVHSAKGLEFDTVFVMDCSDGLFPRSYKVGTHEDNEELRCFYVAVTRAKNHLYIFSPEKVFQYGKKKDVWLSHFIPDDDDLYNFEDKK